MPTRFVLPALGAVVLALLSAILWLNGGTFLYTQDDPYIHLALAEELARGHYGINPGEAAAPSSSILFPLLLAAGVPLGIEALLPLALNLAALAATARLALWLAARWLPAAPPRRLGLLLFLGLLSLNLVGVAFTGLEHSGHVLASLAVLAGLVAVAEGGRMPWWLGVALVVGPLIRYEGLGITAAALVVLACLGFRRQALLLAALALLPLAAHAAWLLHLGLPPLPSSVMMKSPVASSVGDMGAASLPLALLANLYLGLASERGLVLAALAWLVFFGALRVRPPAWRAPESAVAGFALLAVAAHYLGGRFGWLDRYEIYITATMAAALGYVWRRPLGRVLGAGGWRYAALLAAVPAVGWTYLWTTAITPVASNEIYRQQYQMHRFATNYLKAPVAINDLGLVAYRNPNYVLDLWGLGREEIRRTMRDPTARARAIAATTDRYGVGAAMLYENWFRDVLPPAWRPVARFGLGRPPLAVDTATVTVFATVPGDADRLRALFASFAQTLPPGVVFESVPPGGR
jgi:hypothetical protein